MFYKLFERTTGIEIIPYSPSYLKLDSVQVEKDGVISRKSTFKKSDYFSLSAMNMNDFSLSNILAVGAYDILKPTFMVDTNNLNVASQVEESIKQLSYE